MANFDQISTQTAVSELIFSENQPQIDESALPHTRRGSYGNQGSSVISENHTTANPAASIPLERLLAEIGKLVDEFVAGAHARLNTRSRVITNQIDRETEIRKYDDAGKNYNAWQLRRVSHCGIWFKGILYHSLELMYLRHREGTALEVLVKADLSDTGAILVNIPTEQAPLRVTAQASMRLREESTMLENLNTFRQETRPTGKEPSAQRRSPSVRAVAAGRRPPAKRCKSDVAMKEPTTHTVERSNSTCTIHFKIAQPAEEPLGLQQKRVPLGRWILGSRSRRRKRGDGGTR